MTWEKETEEGKRRGQTFGGQVPPALSSWLYIVLGDISERSSKGVMGPLGKWVGTGEEKCSWYFSPLFFPWSEAVPKLFVTQHVSEQTPHLQLTPPPNLRTLLLLPLVYW